MCSKTRRLLNNPSMNDIRTPKLARRIRTKIRKPKFLSLRREISPESDNNKMTHHQLNLFPLHPENLFEEKEMPENVEYFFDQDAPGSDATLTGLLGRPTPSSEDSLSPSLTCTYGGHDSHGGSKLAQTALRSHRRRDASEEKWVSYSEVASVPTATSTTSTAGGEEDGSLGLDLCYHTPGLSLKLDYEEILNAWSDKGPLYIEGESPQTVPDRDDIQAQDSASGLHGDVGSMGNGKIWSVPEEDGCSAIEDDGEEGKMRQREARVMRYKEKRQSRLFSKRIRYEVRKLNAEKRPRMKGRFVKRKEEL